MDKDTLQKFFTQNICYVLRDSRNGKPLGLSYTKEGLKYTYNSNGKNLYYDYDKRSKGAVTKLIPKHNNRGEVVSLLPNNSKRMATNLVVERFMPKLYDDHRDKIESHYIKKGINMFRK
jgi:hypothetical protein